MASGTVLVGYMVYRDDGQGSATYDTVGYDGSNSTALNGVVDGLSGGRTYSFIVTPITATGAADPSDSMEKNLAKDAWSATGRPPNNDLFRHLVSAHRRARDRQNRHNPDSFSVPGTTPQPSLSK